MAEIDEDKFLSWYGETLKSRGLESHPSTLYKYVSSESKHFQLAMHELILHNMIYLSSRKDFNDPFDSCFGVDLSSAEIIPDLLNGIAARHGAESFPDQYVKGLLEDPDKFRIEMAASISRALDEWGIYSLSDT